MRNFLIFAILGLAGIPIAALVLRLMRNERATSGELWAGFASVIIATILAIYVMY